MLVRVVPAGLGALVVLERNGMEATARAAEAGEDQAVAYMVVAGEEKSMVQRWGLAPRASSSSRTRLLKAAKKFRRANCDSKAARALRAASAYWEPNAVF